MFGVGKEKIWIINHLPTCRSSLFQEAHRIRTEQNNKRGYHFTFYVQHISSSRWSYKTSILVLLFYSWQNWNTYQLFLQVLLGSKRQGWIWIPKYDFKLYSSLFNMFLPLNNLKCYINTVLYSLLFSVFTILILTEGNS